MFVCPTRVAEDRQPLTGLWDTASWWCQPEPARCRCGGLMCSHGCQYCSNGHAGRHAAPVGTAMDEINEQAWLHEPYIGRHRD